MKNVLLIIVVFVMLACKKKEENLLLGKWNYIGDREFVKKISTDSIIVDDTAFGSEGDFINFMSNGQLTFSMYGDIGSSTYQFLNGNKIVIEDEESPIILLNKTDLHIRFKDEKHEDTLVQVTSLFKR